jgi:Ser-tRNA(Ala) deacylase AlaX
MKRTKGTKPGVIAVRNGVECSTLHFDAVFVVMERVTSVTLKLFWDDPYQTTVDTRITAVAGAEVLVDRTIFYAFSGGQERDFGTIAGRAVIEARKIEHDIVYTLANSDGLAPGDLVPMTIDWPRRYALMRLHFAAELVLELCYRALPGVQKIGAHIAQEKSRIDFAWPESIAPLLPAIEAQVADLVAADLPITSAFSDVAAERRYWDVPGFARVACGGTHLRRTSEVGLIALRRKKLGSAKERIEITLI